jgi:RNA polymerase sigma-70 factor (ECF subfamily)
MQVSGLTIFIEKAVNELPENHRIVFVLRELEGKSYEDIAEITGCRLGTVKSRLNRARNKFAGIIAPLLS